MDADEVFNAEYHHHTKKQAESWWREGDDIKAKKERRKKHREENKNFNKINKVIIGKGEKKRFYTQPTMRWHQLISNDQTNNNDDDIEDQDESEDEVDDDDDLMDFNRNNTNFDKYTRFDYAEFDDEDNDFDKDKNKEDKDGDIEIDKKDTDGFNFDGNEADEVIEFDDEEEDDDDQENENEKYEMWDIDNIEMDKNVNIENEDKDDKKDKDESKFDIFDENGNCKLTLNMDDDDNIFYRHEKNEEEMWKYWKGIRKKYQKAVYDHKRWAQRKRENDQFEKLVADPETDNKLNVNMSINDRKQKTQNRRAKKRRNRDF